MATQHRPRGPAVQEHPSYPQTCTSPAKLGEEIRKKVPEGLPGGAVVKNPAANAADTGLIPDSGKIPHASEQLSPCATTTEPGKPQLLSPGAAATESRAP